MPARAERDWALKSLTDRQRQVLSFISAYIGEHKYPPAVRDLAGHFAISTKGAYDHLKALERKGYIRCADHRSRAIEVADGWLADDDGLVEVPLLGNVVAGVPLLAEENLDGYIAVSSRLIGAGRHFGLKVRGDSMRDAGILDGDTAIVRQQAQADNGAIVVAMIEETVTLKRLYLEKNRVRLEAENPDYPPIFTQNVRILGKLSAIVRAY